jgi:ketosteroid isomerase-like protein
MPAGRLALVLFLLSIAGCAGPGSGEPAPAAQEEIESRLMEADRAFAQVATDRGIDGWMSYFTEDAARVNLRGPVVRGLDKIREQDSDLFARENVRLRWSPTDAGLFRDGSHGYTRGRYELVETHEDGVQDVLSRGSYLSWWRLEDGRWKVILDTGVADPEPKPSE